MKTVMKARIVQIGNSRGIRIPKVWLDQLGLDDEVEVAVQKDKLVIRRAHRPRFFFPASPFSRSHGINKASHPWDPSLENPRKKGA